MQTKVKELMKADPVIIRGGISLKEAAEKMESVDCGVLPVGTWDQLEGIITDRDIVIRAVAEGVDMSSATVREYMTNEIFFCNENDTLEQAAEAMNKHGVSRLVVRNSEAEPCAIITFGCIMRKAKDAEEIGKVISCAVKDKVA